ncbi:MAG: lytic murein transglycosylase B [Alcanivoracaceae bacterium]|nr:lytic murein transglycosylase B [Alcanivoracaceae bacterium]
MNNRIMMFALAALSWGASGSALASYAEHPEAIKVADELAEEGLDRERVLSLLADAQKQEKILELIARPAEKTLTWADYRRLFVQPDRVEQGIAFWQQHKDTLDAVEASHGVPAEMILAILGVETRYGRHKGTYRVIDALTTLGFDYPPRSKFFRGQLKELFRLEQKAGIDISEVTGSYAGAMGYPQFIPTSYIHYAIDQDDDGRIDLLGNPVDAIGSIANYFKVHGWQAGQPLVARARVQGEAWRKLIQPLDKPRTTLGAAKAAGAVSVSCEESNFCFTGLADDTPAALIELEGEHGSEFWLTTNNFYVITRYNHSYLYAMAAHHLAQELTKHRGEIR